MGRNILYLSKLLLTYSTVFQFRCQLFSNNTILTQFHLIDKEQTGNHKDTCLLLFTRIIMTRFLIVNSTILPSRYVIASIIKDTGFDLKRVQVKKKNELFLTFLIKIGNKSIISMKITHIAFILKDTGFDLKRVQVKKKLHLKY